MSVFCVSVFFLAAMGFAGERHGGQDQGVGRAEYDKRCERTHQPSADMAVSFHHQISFLQSPYQTEQVLICGQEETAGTEGHTHTDDCHKSSEPLCGKEEHIHNHRPAHTSAQIP